MRVNHRHVIYVQGYDPRGLAQYYRMFRTELRKSSKLYGLQASIGRPKSSDDGSMASWSIETQGAGWQTRANYDFLRWEDLIQHDLTWPIWRTVLSAMAIYCQLVFRGIITRFWKAHWRFATFISYPYFVLLNEAIWSAIAALVVGKLMSGFGAPGALSLATAAAVFVAVLSALMKYTERRTYMLYLMSDTIFTWQFAHRQRPEWDRRIERFAHHLVEVARSTDAEEIIVVGHSSGSFLGVEILARALEIDPELGRHGPRVVLLTLGGNLPIVGFLPKSDDFHRHLRQLAVEPSVDWVDCQSRKDVMNFYPFHPILGHGIEVGPARHNPTIVPVRFREVIDPARYNRFRWQFFQVHFQFVMANDRPHAYDFYMIVCGPVSLSDRVKNPAAALAAVTTATESTAPIPNPTVPSL